MTDFETQVDLYDIALECLRVPISAQETERWGRDGEATPYLLDMTAGDNDVWGYAPEGTLNICTSFLEQCCERFPDKKAAIESCADEFYFYSRMYGSRSVRMVRARLTGMVRAIIRAITE